MTLFDWIEKSINILWLTFSFIIIIFDSIISSMKFIYELEHRRHSLIPVDLSYRKMHLRNPDIR